MDATTQKSLKKALADLIAEQRMITNAINTIQTLLGAKTTATRVPASAAKHTTNKKRAASRRKPQWSSAMRKAAKERMKRYWDQRRKGTSKG
ncbi:MAG: hypothetical protein JW841_14155 [Deltaproteobacteria bacterium]|nr:hypothetical protein [Deltaproteobacteria bacterium]